VLQSDDERRAEDRAREGQVDAWLQPSVRSSATSR
jgi:hypothetical protein